MVTWSEPDGKLMLTIHYTKPSETGGMAGGCSMSFIADMTDGYDAAYNKCVKAAKREFNLPELVLKPEPGSIQAMTNKQFTILMGCMIIAAVVGSGVGIWIGSIMIAAVNARGGLFAVLGF